MVIVGAGCSLPGGSGSPSPSPSPTPTIEPTSGPGAATPGATASATPTEGQLDLTRPGEARSLVDDLMAATGSQRAIMVSVTAREASVTVLRSGQPQTWAWRGGQVQQVPSDITYVAQRTFDPDDFALDDVGALFRAAESVSGSRRDQSLQIVDYSAGLVSMSVSTNPESRPVFFHPDGTLLPTLDFTSLWGLSEGYRDAVGDLRAASGLGFGSALGVHLDTPQGADGAYERRQRTARTPVIVTPRTDTTTLDAFDPRLVDPAVVWGVLVELHDEGEFTLDTVWSCVADERGGTGSPLLHFTVGDRSFTTDLGGTVVEG